MTAETDLLPLPDVKRWRAMKDRNGNVGYSDKPDPKYSESAGTDSLTWVRLNDHTAAMRAYARANLAELQREVEGLRAEVAEWKAVAKWEGEQHDSAFHEARTLNARAERLAGALQDARECGNDGDWQSARRIIDAALDQEMANAIACRGSPTTLRIPRAKPRRRSIRLVSSHGAECGEDST